MNTKARRRRAAEGTGLTARLQILLIGVLMVMAGGLCQATPFGMPGWLWDLLLSGGIVTLIFSLIARRTR